MQLFEGADAELVESVRLYALVDEAVREGRFVGVPSRLVAKADALCAQAMQRVDAVRSRAAATDLKRVEALSRRARRARGRLARWVDRRVRPLGAPPAPLAQQLDALVRFEPPPAPTHGWRWRLPVAAASLFVCITTDCCSVSTSLPLVLAVPAWLAFVAAGLPASARPGRTFRRLTLAVPIVALVNAWPVLVAHLLGLLWSGDG